MVNNTDCTRKEHIIQVYWYCRFVRASILYQVCSHRVVPASRQYDLFSPSLVKGWIHPPDTREVLTLDYIYLLVSSIMVVFSDDMESTSPSLMRRSSHTAGNLFFSSCKETCGRGLFGRKWLIHRDGSGDNCEQKCSHWFIRLRLRRGWRCGACGTAILQCPSVCENRVLETREELLEAVDAYLSNGAQKTNVSQIFGSPIGSWCIGSITDLSEVFSSYRNSDARFFDEQLTCWETSSATSMRNMFRGAASFNYPLDHFDVSNVDTMEGVFFGAKSFNQNLNSWNTSDVVDMSNMFYSAYEFNGDVSLWDVSKVEIMDRVFTNAKQFNSNVGQWEVGSVRSMANMFEDALVFNRNLSGWNIGSAVDVSGMFFGAAAFNQNLCSWGASTVITKVYSATDMFKGSNCKEQSGPIVELIGQQQGSFCFGCSQSTTAPTAAPTSVSPFPCSFSEKIAFSSVTMLREAVDDYLSDSSPNTLVAERHGHPIGTWCVGSITDFSYLFAGCRNPSARYFDEDLSGWDMSSAVTVHSMFRANPSFNHPIRSWDLSRVKDMGYLFKGARQFNQSIGDWDVSGVTNMQFLFSGAAAFNQDIGGWDVSKVTAMNNMFEDAESFSYSIGGWDVSRVTDMYRMMANAKSFNGDLNAFQVSKVENMEEMFLGAAVFNSDITSWNVSSVVSMKSMFSGAKAFNQNISSYNVSSVTDMREMFLHASAFSTDLCNWGKITAVTHAAWMSDMFAGSNCLFPSDPRLTSIANGPFCVGCYVQSNKLEAFDAAAGDWFGYSVSASDETIAIGATGEGSSGSTDGSVYVYKRSGSEWRAVSTLSVSDGLEARESFGLDVALSDDTIIVSAHRDSENGYESGSAYIFRRVGNDWSKEAKLTASDAAELDHFGRSVALSGDVAVVGSVDDDENGTNSGSVYVFLRSVFAWTEIAKLTALDGSADDAFGFSIAISGHTLVVGAHRDDDKGSGSGSAHVFKQSGIAWTEEAKLTASDGSEDQKFGYSVDISSDTIAIGAIGDHHSGAGTGAAYIFRRSGSTWTEEAKLLASDSTSGDLFGSSVAISGNRVVVGAIFDDDNGSDSGSGYVFLRSDNSWTENSKILASDGSNGDQFGSSVAISASADTVVIGAILNDHAQHNSGSVYVYNAAF